MPEDPAPRHTGDASHASHPCHRGSGDTPYDEAIGQPMTRSQPRSNGRSVVGGRTYGEVHAAKSEKD